MHTSQILNTAADLIESKGWAKGNCGMAVDGPYCLEGALGAVMGTATKDPGKYTDVKGPVYTYVDVQETAAYHAVKAYLELREYAWAWNDKQVDGSAVVEVLRAAAVIEESRESAAVLERVS